MDLYYCLTPERFFWRNGVLAAIKNLTSCGFLCLIVTNQECIDAGILSIPQLERINMKIRQDVVGTGGRISGIYVCPHKPKGGLPAKIYNHFGLEMPEDEKQTPGCSCRKPRMGLFMEAAQDYPIDFSNSWMIGDSCSDILAGRCMGMRTIQVVTRWGDAPDPTADYRVKSVLEGSKIITKRYRK